MMIYGRKWRFGTPKGILEPRLHARMILNTFLKNRKITIFCILNLWVIKMQKPVKTVLGAKKR